MAKKKGEKLRANGLSLGHLCRFCRYVLGIAAKPNTSIFDLSVEALRRSGFPNTANIRPRKFVIEHRQYILDHQAKKTARVVREHIPERQPVGPTYEQANSDAFLLSYEWRRVRMQALKEHGARCQCCGATPADGVKMHVDHIKPRRIFPQLALDPSNLQVLCEACNHGKGNWDQTDWRPKEEEIDPEVKAFLKSI